MMMTVRRTIPIAAACLALAGAACSADDAGQADPAQGSADGAADGLVEGVASGKADGWSAIAAELGGSYRLEVAAKQSGEVTPANAKVLRFEAAAGQAFAATMRRTDASELDAALILYEVIGDGSANRVASSLAEQAAVPMAVAEDAAVSHQAPAEATYLLYASDAELAVTGAFQVDLVPVELPALAPELGAAWAAVTLSVTNPALRALMAEQRADEPAVSTYAASGALSEGADGLLVRHEEVLGSLQERQQLRLLTARVNDLRAEHFDELAAAAGSDDPRIAARSGQLCGALWGALRTAQHQLP